MARISLVTGAARGLGLEFCKQLLERGDTVVACPRRDGEENLARLAAKFPDRAYVVTMDVSDDDAIAAAAATITEHVDHIDVLLNNAGYYPQDGSVRDGLDTAELMRAFRINTIGPLEVVHALLPLLRKGSDRLLVQITSLMGSIDDNTSGGSYGYRMSKTALNMGVKNLAHELGSEGFTSLVVHPGWVRTDMGGAGAPLSIAPTITSILDTVFNATRDDNGAFLAFDGRRMPW